MKNLTTSARQAGGNEQTSKSPSFPRSCFPGGWTRKRLTRSRAAGLASGIEGPQHGKQRERVGQKVPLLADRTRPFTLPRPLCRPACPLHARPFVWRSRTKERRPSQPESKGLRSVGGGAGGVGLCSHKQPAWLRLLFFLFFNGT